ncbi:tRNA (guanine(26)-N(2))-dimethyltransferase [Candidatus Woesearchaeota archaeon]|nr:tRNA (guanine(26)-N(2))-dimethyltransferase [Candidatus Woesearchaeota archaeon]
MKKVTEGKTKICVETQQVVNKKMPSFYNPVMTTNRDFTLLVLNALEKKELTIIDPLAGTGIRSLRILKELKPEKTKKIVINDIKKGFKEKLEQNLELNKLSKEKIIIRNEDANKVLNTEGHFDYVDIDPFGTPNPFLDSAIRALNRNAILGVTATDTSALCGSYSSACKRKYWAEPLRNELMHEFATRILIRKVQLIGAQHEKALTPLVSYATDHYIKIFFESQNNKTKTDEILKKHELYKEKGPIWTGIINNHEFIKKMLNQNLEINKKTLKLLKILEEESTIQEPFFYDLHEIASQQKTKTIPRKEQLIQELQKTGYEATRTHFNENAIKTNASKKELIKKFKKIIR